MGACERETYCDGDEYDAGAGEEVVVVEALPNWIPATLLVRVQRHLRFTVSNTYVRPLVYNRNACKALACVSNQKFSGNWRKILV